MKIGCGHGHVYRNPNGTRARCGGPLLCGPCARDLAQQCADIERARGQQTLVPLEQLVAMEEQFFPMLPAGNSAGADLRAVVQEAIAARRAALGEEA
jgi:hypothetical protein